jgi:HPt (histidine-containing phosphotransfer) domain-containing protein
MFIPDAEARLKRIDLAIKEHDFKELEEAAHGLKSGAANVGATDMAQLCQQLETQGERNSIGNSVEVMKKLVVSWSTIRELLARFH